MTSEIDTMRARYTRRLDYWLDVAARCRQDQTRRHLEHWALEIAGIFADLIARIDAIMETVNGSSTASTN